MHDVRAMLDDEFAQLVEGARLGDFEMHAAAELVRDAQDGLLLLLVIEPRLIGRRARGEKNPQRRCREWQARRRQRGPRGAADGAAGVGDEELAIRAGEQLPREIQAIGIGRREEQAGRGVAGHRVVRAGERREKNVPQLPPDLRERHGIGQRAQARLETCHEVRHVSPDGFDR